MRRNVHVLATWLASAGLACGASHVSRPKSVSAREGSEVDVGWPVQSQATLALDVLVPARGSIPDAVRNARAAATAAGLTLVAELPERVDEQLATVQLVSVDDEGWSHRFPGYAVSVIDRNEFSRVDDSAGVVRIESRGPAADGWELARRVTTVARDVAASQDGWIYDRYRAQLHDADTLGVRLPDPAQPDVRAVMRQMGVHPTKGGLDHIRTIGLWHLGLPELIVDDIPHACVDQTMSVVRATAQALIQNHGFKRRGRIDVSVAALPADWQKPASGSGTFAWAARWRRGQIHHNAMEIVLAPLRAKPGDPTALVAALRTYAGSDCMDSE